MGKILGQDNMAITTLADSSDPAPTEEPPAEAPTPCSRVTGDAKTITIPCWGLVVGAGVALLLLFKR